MTNDLPSRDDTMALGKSLKWGIGVALFILIGAVVWAALAPISGGALATGQISPDGSRRTVQHLEGGIIDRIMVRNGDVVTAGDPIIALNETRNLAERNIILGKLRSLRADEARLEAAQYSLPEIVFPFDEGELSDPQVQELVTRQQRFFQQSKNLHEARVALLNERIEQYRAEIRGLRATITSVKAQQVLLREEMDDAAYLLEQGLSRKPRLLAMQRMDADFDGQVANAEATIARLEGQISETRAQILELEAERLEKNASQLAEVRVEIQSSMERLDAAEDVLNRTLVLAPISGEVVNLRFSTDGGVVRPGEAIVDIVPNDEALVIEARISPTDVDIVEPGLSARIVFSALPQRGLPTIEGEVTSVSADALVDEVTGMSYFTARIEVDQDLLDRYGLTPKLSVGMPAEVMITTETRTVLEYLLEPLVESTRRAFREG